MAAVVVRTVPPRALYRAKVLTMMQALLSLVILAVLVSRAINALAAA